MRIVVVGGTGTMGRLVLDRLAARPGITAVPASRASGVDASTGAGLDAAFVGADVVLDATNVATTSRTRAVATFAAISVNIIAAAARAKVGHLVLLSILNVDRPEVQRLGYYAGKAQQEEFVRAVPRPTTIVATSQWFEFVPTLLAQYRVGPVSLVPHVRAAPMAAASAADLLTEVLLGEPCGRREAAGPEDLDLYDLARAWTGRHGGRVLPVPAVGPLGALADGGLLPGPGVPRVGPSWDRWWAEH